MSAGELIFVLLLIVAIAAATQFVQNRRTPVTTRGNAAPGRSRARVLSAGTAGARISMPAVRTSAGSPTTMAPIAPAVLQVRGRTPPPGFEPLEIGAVRPRCGVCHRSIVSPAGACRHSVPGCGQAVHVACLLERSGGRCPGPCGGRAAYQAH